MSGGTVGPSAPRPTGPAAVCSAGPALRRPLRCRFPTPSSAWSARHSIRSRARWTAERWICSRSASSGRWPRGSRGGRRPRDAPVRLPGQPPSASSASIASSWRAAAATPRWRLADSALRTRLRSPRTERDTWRASSSSSAAPPPTMRRNVPTVSALFQVTTPRPRRSRQEAGSPRSPRRRARTAASSAPTTNSRWVRPAARLSDPWARKRPRKIRGPAVLGRARPVEG